MQEGKQMESVIHILDLGFLNRESGHSLLALPMLTLLVL